MSLMNFIAYCTVFLLLKMSFRLMVICFLFLLVSAELHSNICLLVIGLLLESTWEHSRMRGRYETFPYLTESFIATDADNVRISVTFNIYNNFQLMDIFVTQPLN